MGRTLVWQVRSSEKEPGKTLIKSLGSEKGTGWTLVWQVRRQNLFFSVTLFFIFFFLYFSFLLFFIYFFPFLPFFFFFTSFYYFFSYFSFLIFSFIFFIFLFFFSFYFFFNFFNFFSLKFGERNRSFSEPAVPRFAPTFRSEKGTGLSPNLPNQGRARFFL